MGLELGQGTLEMTNSHALMARTSEGEEQMAELAVYAREKLCQTELNRQGGFHSRQLQQGRETELNSTEVKGGKVFKC